MESIDFKHYSVMAGEVIEGLNIKPDGIYVDGTMGGAGHGSLICERLETGRYIGIDRDADAIKAGTERLAAFGERATVVRSSYSEMKNVLQSLYKQGRRDPAGPWSFILPA